MANRIVKIKYLKAHDSKTSLVTGVHGGITSNGMISANFFTDSAGVPTATTLEIDERGLQVGMPKDERDTDLVREVQFSAMIDIRTAKVIVGWLNSKISEYENITLKRN